MKHRGFPLHINAWKALRTLVVLVGASHLTFAQLSLASDTPPEHKPWTRWWWLGNAVDRENLTKQLEHFRDAGIGGVEICPIYGVKGWEDRHIDFLSPQWMDMFGHTLREAKRIGLGVDLTTGTGWPFGGPQVTPDIASSRVILKAYDLAEGERLNERLSEGQLACLRGVSAEGQFIDLTSRVSDRRLDWTAPTGNWRLYAVVQQGPVQRVKRAAPGGAGSVLDPYSTKAIHRYLQSFDSAFEAYSGPMPRAQFHDSFEYYRAQWTPDLFQAFSDRKGYDLRDELPALFGDGEPDRMARVKSDYREVLFELHLDYIRAWTGWAHQQQGRTRNQAHGAPGNLCDLYGAVDIPETEIFRAPDEAQIPMQKFASSAAHILGNPLVSAESFTWLNEHFQTSLAQLKPACDHLLLSGVNHIFFHGVPYSPESAEWPGWQFYASVNFGPQGGLWRDLPAFNAYVQRCQTLLQSGAPANDVLLYYPFHDLIHDDQGLLKTFTVHNQEDWLQPQPFYTVAMQLWNRGYGHDFVSDRQLMTATVNDGNIVTPGGMHYRVLLLPHVTHMPVGSLDKILQLAQAGATVLVHQDLPTDVPGLHNLQPRRTQLQQHRITLNFQTSGTDIRVAKTGRGALCIGPDIEALLASVRIQREPMLDSGLRFIRRRLADGYGYFVVNGSHTPVDDWVPMAPKAESVEIIDPLQADRIGTATVRPRSTVGTDVYLQLAPGQSCLLRTYDTTTAKAPAWRYHKPTRDTRTLKGSWEIAFIEGGPALPKSYRTDTLAAWTDRPEPAFQNFSGTARYRLSFEAPEEDVEQWAVDLGEVRESARVRLNGWELGVLWCSPFTLGLGDNLRPGKNTLEIEVTNLAANRVADLDRRKVPWKYFHDANVVTRDYKPFDAADWPVLKSGLVGPVQLVRLQPFTPSAR